MASPASPGAVLEDGNIVLQGRHFDANPYHHVVSWCIAKEDWNRPENLVLEVDGPVQMGNVNGIYNGDLRIEKDGLVAFCTVLPKEFELTKLNVEAVFSLLDEYNNPQGSFKLSERFVTEFDVEDELVIQTRVKIHPEQLYNQTNTFILQADFKIGAKDLKKDINTDLRRFVEDIKSFFVDENYDVLVCVEQHKFKCHKALLSARSVIFKNMLAHDALESRTNTIDIKHIPVEAVGDMLKFIYSGKLPVHTKSDNIDLLHAADMYQLDELKEACVDILVNSLDVSTCITTLILADRFIPHVVSVREDIIKFMKCKAVEVVDEEDWDKLMDNFPALGKELVKAIVKSSKEKHVCKHCVVSYPSD